MSKSKVDFSALQKYLPNGSYDAVLDYIYQYKIQLTVARSRQSILGDYRHAYQDKGHRISVNGDLNIYAFLVTLLHEIAHLITFEKHGRNVQPHGQEWKQNFGNLLSNFVGKNIFPEDVEKALQKSIQNPAASSCGDERLLRVLKKYDTPKEGVILLEQLPAGAVFKIKGERVFIKGEKIRKRIKCQEVATKKWYLFSPVYEIVVFETK
jgi:SprT protein